MRRKLDRKSSRCLALGVTGMAVSLSAHHAFAAEFDANKPVQMKGTVTKMEWLNPHVWLHMDVKQPDGTSRTGRSRLARRTCSSGAASPGSRFCPAPWS